MSQAAELFDDTPEAPETPAPEAATPAATPEAAAKPETPSADPDGYEHEALKSLFKGKYKTFADIEKGYSESSKQAREFKTAAEKAEERWKMAEGVIGAPVDEEGKPAPYDFKLPEEVTIVPELMEAFQKDLRDMNLAPSVGQKVLDRYVAVEAGMESARRDMERDFVVQQIGGGDEAVAAAAVGETLAWVRQVLGDSPEIEDLLTSNGATSSYGKPLALLHHLRAAMTGAKLGASSGTGAFGKADYDALMQKAATRGLNHDEAAKIAAYLNSAYPDSAE